MRTGEWIVNWLFINYNMLGMRIDKDWVGFNSDLSYLESNIYVNQRKGKNIYTTKFRTWCTIYDICIYYIYKIWQMPARKCVCRCLCVTVCVCVGEMQCLYVLLLLSIATTKSRWGARDREIEKERANTLWEILCLIYAVLYLFLFIKII